jgi:uncharacterized protein YegP (UPF0339 family)
MTIEIYRDKAAEWRWRAKASNGAIIAVSGEGYINIADMRTALFRLRADLPTSEMIEVDE